MTHVSIAGEAKDDPVPLMGAGVVFARSSPERSVSELVDDVPLPVEGALVPVPAEVVVPALAEVAVLPVPVEVVVPVPVEVVVVVPVPAVVVVPASVEVVVVVVVPVPVEGVVVAAAPAEGAVAATGKTESSAIPTTRRRHFGNLQSRSVQVVRSTLRMLGDSFILLGVRTLLRHAVAVVL